MIRLAIWASGGGSNAKEIITYFKDRSDIKVALVLSSKPAAGVIAIAKTLGIPYKVMIKKDFRDPKEVLDTMELYGVDWIILAGFLLKVPESILRVYNDKVINIHPGLLPKYGGKGMYGINVHKAVKQAGESVSGITIHLANENYDEGQTLFQASTTIDASDSPEDIAAKVLQLEHYYYSRVIETTVGGGGI